MMGTEKTLVNVNKGQDPYSVIGNYIRNHIKAIEDMIAVIQINGVIINELYMVDVDADGYFYWGSDWWEGEEDVALLDFFPVSDAERIKWIPCSERLPEEYGVYRITWVTSSAPSKRFLGDSEYEITSVWDEERKEFKGEWLLDDYIKQYPDVKVIAWKPLEEPYREGEG